MNADYWAFRDGDTHWIRCDLECAQRAEAMGFEVLTWTEAEAIARIEAETERRRKVRRHVYEIPPKRSHL